MDNTPISKWANLKSLLQADNRVPLSHFIPRQIEMTEPSSRIVEEHKAVFASLRMVAYQDQ